MYGLMPDWNPAEIIGCKPKPLSLSLYRGNLSQIQFGLTKETIMVIKI